MAGRQDGGSGQWDCEAGWLTTPPGRRRRETASRAGYALTVAGAHGSIYAHFGAHLLPAVALPGTPVDDLLVALYLGAWVLAGAGVGVYGVAVLAGNDARAGAVVAATPPLGLLAGATAVALGLGSVGDGLKLPFALGAAAAATHAWVASGDDAATAGVGQSAE